MVSQLDVALADGRTIRAYDSGGTGLTVLWHHGSPQTGALLPPLLDACADRGIRLVSYARPSYLGSTPNPRRTVASAASDVNQIADALGVDAFAVMGASGGGPHALACAALLPRRVTAAVCLAGVAPFTDEFDWFGGMADASGPRAARAGRDARAKLAESDEFDPEIFVAAYWAALEGAWSSLGEDAQRAGAYGPDGLIDDDVAFVSDWGFTLDQVHSPVLLLQGGLDRVVPPSHAEWMSRSLPRAELEILPQHGHVSILDACPRALDWVLEHS